MQLNDKQVAALETIVDYILVNERTHFMEYVSEGGNPADHIYSKAVMLNELGE